MYRCSSLLSRALVALGTSFALAALGCGSSSDTSPTNTGAGPTTTATTTGSGGSGGGATTGGGGTGGAAPTPIDAPDNAWTWVPFDNAFCGNGTPTGLGINPIASSKKVAIFLEGGGACYSTSTCTGSMASTANFDGFGPNEFADFKLSIANYGVFDRSDPGNPFRDYSIVFVPYCTGDVHAGDKVGSSLNFVGHANLAAYLERLVPTFPSIDQVVLSGWSAGGLGAMYDFYQVQKAFGSVPAVLVDDSGPFFPLSVTPSLSFVVNLWGLSKTIPPGCADCLDGTVQGAGLDNLIPYYGAQLPGRRGSLISSLQDDTISSYFMLSQSAFETALNSLADTIVPENPDFHVFFLSSTHHVWLLGDPTTHKLSDVVSNGVSLSTFLQQELSGDPAWQSVLPAP